MQRSLCGWLNRFARRGAAGCGLSLLLVTIASGQEGGAESATLPPHLQRLQQNLGGPAIQQFPSLRSEEPLPLARTIAAPRNVQRQAIETLRDAAWQLDTAANRLERLELYGMADKLRQQAQQLRLDARGMIDGEERVAPKQPGMRAWEWGHGPSAVEAGTELQPANPPEPLEPRVPVEPSEQSK